MPDLEDSVNGGEKDQLKVLKGRLAVAQASVKKIANFVKLTELTSENKALFKGKLDNLLEAYIKFEALHFQILACLEKEREILELNTSYSDVEDIFYEARAIIESKLDIGKTEEVIETKELQIKDNDNHKGTIPNLKFPKIQIKSFNGKTDNWLKFYETFKTIIHDSTGLKKIEKFYYLVNCLEGEAAELISDIDINEHNYTFAWETLVNRYKNNKLLIETHVGNLFQASKLEVQSAKGLRELFNIFIKNINALKKLNVSVEGGDVFLVYLLTSKLDKLTLQEWEKESQNKKEMPSYDELYKFIEKRCNYLEAIESKSSKGTAGRGLLINSNKDRSFNKMGNNYNNKGARAMLTYASENNIQCPFCTSKEHTAIKCETFKNASIEKRRELVKEKKLCWVCLSVKHRAFQCKNKVCYLCKQKHNFLLCRNAKNNFDIKNSSLEKEKTEQTIDKRTSLMSHHFYSNSFFIKNNKIVLATVLIFIEDVFGNLIKGIFLLDSGSEVNFISNNFAKKLNIKPDKDIINIRGIGNTKTQSQGIISVNMKSRIYDYSKRVKFNIIEKITERACDAEKLELPWSLPDNVYNNLADPKFYKLNKEIDGLLGAPILFEVLREERYYPDGNGIGPYFLNTNFGWIISGEFSNLSNKNNSLCLMGGSDIQMKVSKIPKSKLDNQFCEDLFNSTTIKHTDGRYIVHMPLFKEPNILGDSLEIARKRFFNLEKKLNQCLELKTEYSLFINEYLEMGHMEVVPDHEIDIYPNYYLPHHAVFKQSTTTSVRVVFDASSKASGGYSLNDIMYIGPSLQNDICQLILSFRFYKFGLTADIEKMFRQLWVTPEQTNLLRILWRDSPDKQLTHYRLRTVTYGTGAAPFLAIRCLKQVASEIKNEEPDIAEIIEHKFFMDDLLTGADDYDTLIRIKTRLEVNLKGRGMNLRKWCSNSRELQQEANVGDIKEYFIDINDNSVKVLGLGWNPSTDNFIFQCKNWNEGIVTKRIILSEINGIWDPIGILAPIWIKCKMFLQELWLLGLKWDEPISEELSNKWIKFRKSLSEIKNIELPRRVISCEQDIYELHGFSDASEKAYACCIYVRSVNNRGQLELRLLCAKARVAPLQLVTIPRLELLGALMLAELMNTVINSLKKKVIVYYWTDSEIVLSWINGHSQNWKTYVANRVSQIQQLTEPEQWSHVPSDANPADLASRGCSIKDFKEKHLWWEGPQFLLNNSDTWPKWVKNNIEVPDRKPIVYSLSVATNPKEPDKIRIWEFLERNILNKFSTWPKIKRLLAYCFRFINNCKLGTEGRNLENLTVEELNKSESFIIRNIQEKEFEEVINSLNKNQLLPKNHKFKSLSLFLDEKGIIRVGGRLNNIADVSIDQKNPILLPNKHFITKLIMRYLHYKHCHVGAQTLLCITRCRFWPIKGKVLSREIVNNCIICNMVKPKLKSTIMADLPKERITPARPFEIVGVDFCGPVYVKTGLRKFIKIKTYIAVFVCFVIKAVHLELVSDLSTNAFLAAFRRFCARRGKPKIVYSDNGTNFVGANKEINKIFDGWDKVIDESTLEGVEWRFIPPSSPHFGGLWEAAVKSLKYHLVRIMGRSCLSFEETCTLITQIEAVLNSRPLSPLSNDPNDPSVLTPAHFLVGGSLLLPIDSRLTEIPENRLNRWKRIQQLYQHFWSRWSIEYLTTVQQRTKWCTSSKNIEIGTLVLLKEDGLPPLYWKRARVTQLHPGPDGIVRVVTIRLPNGVLYKRPIVKLAPLFKDD